LAPDQSVVLNLNPFFVLEEGAEKWMQVYRIVPACSTTVLTQA
jgi:hypothetical protein